MRFFGRKEKDKFGEILIAKGLATRQEVEDALRVQKDIRLARQAQKSIGAILSEKGVIGPEDINAVLEEQKKREDFILKGLVYSIFHSTQPK
jgi:hypothetical protein